MEKTRRYWGFRIYREKATFFRDELVNKSILRQGWGYKKEQDLLHFTSSDKSDKKNLYMLEVMKNDLLFVHSISQQGYITIAKASEDWRSGYHFSISDETGETGGYDFGHMFPALFLCDIKICKLPKVLQSKIQLPPRFGEIRDCEKEIETLIGIYGTNI